MTQLFKDLVNNGKIITITNRSELISTGTVYLQLQSKDNQAGIVLNETTNELFVANKALGGTYRFTPINGVYSYTYDFATHGGAVSEIELDGPPLPASCDVIDGYYDVITEFDGGIGSTFSLGTSATNDTDLKADAVLATNGSTGRKILTPDYHVNGITNIIDISATAKPVIKITTTAVTAGKLELFLFTIPRAF